MPEVLWHEPDHGALGRPFYVMARVDGRVPPDGHAFDGWVKQLASDDQSAAVRWRARRDLASIHAVDVGRASLGRLERPEHGTSPLDQELGYWRAYLGWAADGDTLSGLEDPFDWCRAPAVERADRGLVWGDARLGNLVVGDDLRPIAVLDWEMAVLGPPELDLGWYLFLERTALQYTDQLPGFPDRAGTIAAYEQRLGRPVRDLDWYEAWGGFRSRVHPGPPRRDHGRPRAQPGHQGVPRAFGVTKPHVGAD